MQKLYDKLISNISYAVKSSLLEQNFGKSGDEYYTRPQDAEKEINKFHEYYKGKIVYCNCDDPSWSEIYKTLKRHFHEYGIKHLIATYMPRESRQAYRIDYDGETVKKHKIKSGQFQDNENIMQEADIVISSPPFSDKLAVTYLLMCVRNKVKFLFIGPLQLWRKSDEIIELFKKGIVMADDTSINKFIRPNPTDKDTAPCAWYTNFPIKERKKQPVKKFKDIEQIYDQKTGYLYVQYFEDIPVDYYEPISTSERFITHINLNKYKILGKNNPKISGKRTYTQILIQKINKR